MNIQGIIFDLDGTLVNTEPLHMDAWLGVLAKQGLFFDEEWFKQWIGLPDRVLAESVTSDHDLQASSDELRILKGATYRKKAATEAQLYPQVEAGLQALKPRYKLAIATSSSRDEANAVFASTQVNNFFQTIVTSSDIKQLKPAPDCYLLAASQLGINPAFGIALEDSVAGVRAAKTAGLYTIAVANSHPEEKLGEADRVFPNTAQAIDWILKEEWT